MPYRLELYDRTNRTCFGFIPSPQNPVVREVLGEQHTLSFDLPDDHPLAGFIAKGAVLRLQKEGVAVPEAAFRISKRGRSLGPRGGRYRRITAAALWTDLRRGLVSDAAGSRRNYTVARQDLTALEWLRDVILPHHISGEGVAFVLGTVEPTVRVSLEFVRLNPLTAARQLIEALQRKAAVGELDFVLGADGRTYTVNVWNRMGRVNGAVLRLGQNVTKLDVDEDDGVPISRLSATGQGLLTLADARWKIVTKPNASAVTLEGSPIPESSAFVGMYFFVPGKGGVAITGTGVATQRLNLAAAAFAAGDEGYFSTDAAGTAPLSYIEIPSAVAAYGVVPGEVLVADDIPDARNLLLNADGSLVLNGQPANWTPVGGATVTEDNDPLHFNRGGRAWRILAPGDGAGILSDPFTIPTDTERPYLGMLSEVFAESVDVRMELRHSNGQTYPVHERSVSQGRGVLLAFGKVVSDQPVPAGAARLAVVAHGGGGLFSWNSSMVTALLAGDVPTFVYGQAAQLLWERAVADLLRRSKPPTEFTVGFLDRYWTDPELYPHDQVGLGDTVLLEAPPIASGLLLRVVDLSSNPWAGGIQSVVVAVGPDQRLVDAWRPTYGPERLPSKLTPVASPDPVRSRVSVTHTTTKTRTTGTLRVEIAADPDQAVAAVVYFETGPDGTRQGPLAPDASGAAWSSRTVALHPEHNVMLDAVVQLRDGRSITVPSATFDHDGNANIGQVSTFNDGLYGLALATADTDTVKVWVQQKAGGSWGTPVQATLANGQASYNGARSAAEAKEFRMYGENAAGVQNVDGARSFYFDRYEDPTQEPPQAPAARIDLAATPPPNANSERLNLSGALGTGGATPLRWRTKTTLGSTGQVITSGWTAVAGPNFSTDILVGRDLRWTKRVVLEVEDGAGRLTASEGYPVDGRNEGVGDDGRVNPSVPYGGGTRRPVDTDEDATAGRRADNDLGTAQGNGNFDRAGGRVLRVRDSDTGQDVTGSVLADGSRRARNGLNTAGRVTSGLERGADVAGIPSGLVSRGGSTKWMETFETFDPAAWIVRQGAPSIGTLLLGGGNSGGNALRITQYAWFATGEKVPYDVTKLYRFRVRARRHGVGTFGKVFFGLEGIAQDGVTLVNATGVNEYQGQYYIAAFDEYLPADASYGVYTGWVRGVGTPAHNGVQADGALPGVMHPAVAYVRPVLIVNYTNGTETIDIDMVSLEAMDEELAKRGYGALASGGGLNAHVVQLSNGSGLAIGKILGTGTWRHGDPVTFTQPPERPVRICYLSGGITHVPAWSDQYRDLGFDNLTPEGGTFRALIRQLAGALVERTLIPSSGVATNPHGQAYNDRYEFNFTVTLPSRDTRFGLEGSHITVGFYSRLPGGVWTKADARSYDNHTGSSQTVPDRYELARDGLGAGSEFKMVVESASSDGPGFPTLVHSNVFFREGTSPNAQSMTPPGSDSITVQILAD